MPLPHLLHRVAECHDWLQSHGHDPAEPVMERLRLPWLRQGDELLISFSSNNYLGLSDRPEVIAAASAALWQHTLSTSESRRLGGTIPLLTHLEQQIARFKQSETALVFATGLLANVATIPALTGADRWCQRFGPRPGNNTSPSPVILGDHLNHRSIQMGITLAQVPHHRYRHCDVAHLEELLHHHREHPVLIVTDAIFSMDGELSPLPKIVELARIYGATLMIDDAHGTGVFGATGQGSTEHWGVTGEVPIQMGTFSKALGGLGGFVAVPREVGEFMRYTASGYRFTSSLPAEQAAGIVMALELLQAEPQLRGRLWRNIILLREGLREIGIPAPRHWSQIIPLPLPDSATASAMAEILRRNGMFCPAILPPLVTTPRLRISLTAAHTPEQLARLLETLQMAWRGLKLPEESASLADWERFRSELPDYVRRLPEVDQALKKT